VTAIAHASEPAFGRREQATSGSRRPRMRAWVLFSVAVVVAFFGLIFSRISLDRSAFVLEDLEQQISQEESRQGALRVEVARLQSPDRISRLAEDMGLVYPSSLVSLRAPEPIRPIPPAEPPATGGFVEAARP